MTTYDSPRLRKNNFDLLRLLFAGTVCLVHADELSRYQPINWISNVFSADAAVKSFFVVSGFLIFMSFERSSSLFSYANKRIRRIYPAYATVVLVSAIGLVIVSTNEPSGYFTFEWFKYVVFNLLFLNFLQPTLPGVFQPNIFTAVNGALWTLKIEVLFYMSVPLFFYLFRKFPKIWVLASTYLVSVIFVQTCNTFALKTGNSMYSELGRQLPGQLRYFLSGAFFYYYLPLFEKYSKYFLTSTVAILVLHQIHPLIFFEPFALATVVAYFGLFFYVGEFGKYGDFSYGVYILHFPILQIFISYGWLRETPWLYLAFALLTTILAAILLWHGVEKRFLLRGSHYIAQSTSSKIQR